MSHSSCSRLAIAWTTPKGNHCFVSFLYLSHTIMQSRHHNIRDPYLASFISSHWLTKFKHSSLQDIVKTFTIARNWRASPFPRTCPVLLWDDNSHSKQIHQWKGPTGGVTLGIDRRPVVFLLRIPALRFPLTVELARSKKASRFTRLISSNYIYGSSSSLPIESELITFVKWQSSHWKGVMRWLSALPSKKWPCSPASRSSTSSSKQALLGTAGFPETYSKLHTKGPYMLQLKKQIRNHQLIIHNG